MLGHHSDNILPSNISPRTVNGSSKVKIPIIIQLGTSKYNDELQVYLEQQANSFHGKQQNTATMLPYKEILKM